MNCKQVENQLPLYVGHDLEGQRARLITAHLVTCTQCARLVEEHEEAHQLLRQFSAPQFSEATYASVRQSVLRQIEQESSPAQGMFAGEWLMRLFQPRLTWAISTGVLLGVCAFAYYFVAHRTNGPQNGRQVATLPVNAGSAPAPATSSPPTQLPVQHHPVAPSAAGSHLPTATSSGKPRLRLHQTVRRNGTRGGSLTTALTSPKPGLNQTAGQFTIAGEAPLFPGAVPATFDTSLSARKPMRLEIQTRDPNIRIIWFSQPSPPEGSPNESSKGI